MRLTQNMNRTCNWNIYVGRVVNPRPIGNLIGNRPVAKQECVAA